MKKFLTSLIKDIGHAIRKNEYVEELLKRHPREVAFFGRRWSKVGRYGRVFTFGVVISFGLFFFFMGLAQDILARDPFVEADIRMMNLVALFRTPETAQVFLFFTHLGSGAVIMGIGGVLALLFGLSGRKRMMLFLLGSIVAGQAMYGAFKLLVHRARPDEVFAWVPRGGYSFPSGHTTSSILFYGLLAFFLWRMAKKGIARKLVVLVFGIGIFLIGFSRVYLGVHWPSDVLAGWALGGSLLVVFISFFLERERFDPESKERSFVSKRNITVLALVSALGLGAFIFHYYSTHPLIIRAVQPGKELVISKENGALEKTILSDSFPKYSETLTGKKMEPISFVVIGSKEDLIRAFTQAGWQVADAPHARDLSRLARASISNTNYPTAPVTPSFIATEPNILAFEKSTEKNTIRERHHTRYWKTDYRAGNAPVWIATASFDNGIKFFITHSIAPDVDAEREYIRNDLVRIGVVEEIGKLQIVAPFLGQNQAADQFFTDGKAYLLRLR